MPLFPLNVVLFPAMPLHLHIFEERYKLMINRCLETQTPFGVVLIRQGVEALGPVAQPHEVGCAARIVQVERLSEGRMNLLVVGADRFRIVSLRNDQPYLVGQVEAYPLWPGAVDAARRSEQALRPLVERYVRLVAQNESVDEFIAQIPGDPAAFANLAATLLQIPPGQRQALLDIASLSDFLSALDEIYRRELALQSSLLAAEPQKAMGSFSDN